MTKIKTITQLTLFSAFLIISLACGSSTIPTTSTHTKLKWKGKNGDQIIAYSIEGTLTSPGSATASSTYDLNEELAELELKPDQSYRIRLKRNNLEYIETIILEDQFNLANDGTLDIGELSGISSAMSWAAYEAASLSESFTVESSLKSSLEKLALVSDIRVLSDINNKSVNESILGKEKIAQLNTAIVNIARVSKQLETSSLSQSDWNEKVTLLSSIFSHPQNGGSKIEAANLQERYLDLFNQGTNKLATINSSEVDNQFITQTSSEQSAFVTLVQSTNSSDLQTLFTQMGL